jgi:hypothetical protein
MVEEVKLQILFKPFPIHHQPLPAKACGTTTCLPLCFSLSLWWHHSCDFIQFFWALNLNIRHCRMWEWTSPGFLTSTIDYTWLRYGNRGLRVRLTTKVCISYYLDNWFLVNLYFYFIGISLADCRWRSSYSKGNYFWLYIFFTEDIMTNFRG